MPPKAWVDYIVFVIDCTNNADEYLQTLYKIAARKFCGKAKSNKDVYRVIFFNNPNSKSISYMTDWSLYDLQSLKQFKTELDKVGTPSDKESIVAALTAAVDCFRSSDIKNPCTKRIVFMTDLNAPAADKDDLGEKIREIRTELAWLNVWLYVIGSRVHVPVIYNEADVLKMNQNIQPVGEVSAEQRQNFDILRKIFELVYGVVVDLENGMDLVFSLKPGVKAPYPWYVELNIGEDIRVPVTCFRTTRSYEKPKFYPVNFKREHKVLDNIKTWHDVHSHEIVPKEDVASGYSFHGKIVILNPNQEKRSSPDTKKCLSIVAFVDEDQIKKELYFLGTMYVIVPNKRQINTDKGLRTLIETMRMKKVVAIAKRVYNNRYNPHLFCIFPCPEHPRCLLMAKLPFSHEFLDTYRAGQPAKLELANPELKAHMYGFLDSMNANTDMHGGGEPIDPLPEYMKLNRNRLYKYEYLAMRNLGVEPQDPPVLGPDSELQTRSEQYADNLIEYFQENS